jgi:hypothetical protein
MVSDNRLGWYEGKDAGYLAAKDLEIFIAVAQTRR